MEKSEKSQIQKIQVFEAISELILEGGLSNITLSKIGKKVGKTKNFLFYYFDGKEAMLREYVHYFIKDQDVSYIEDKDEIFAMEDIKEALERYIHSLYFSIESYEQEYYQIYTEIMALSYSDDYIKNYFVNLQKLTLKDFHNDLTYFKEKGAIRDHVDIQECANELLVEISGISLNWGTTFISSDLIESFAEAKVRSMLEKLMKAI